MARRAPLPAAIFAATTRERPRRFADAASALAAAATSPRPDWLRQALAVEAIDGTVEVEGAAIAYRAWNLDDRTLPGLVLVHGFRAHAHWWDHIASLLAEDHRVVALSFSGMGDSGCRETYARIQFAREILAVADHCGLARPTIVGHSFGGSPTVIAARLAPERIERAILVDCLLEFRGDIAAERERLAKQRFYPDRARALSRFRLIPPGRWPEPHVLKHIADNSLVLTPNGWTWAFDPLLGSALDPEPLADLSRIAVPFDYLYGALSEAVSPERAAEIAGQLQNCGAPTAIPVSHHHVMIEQPLSLVAALRALLARPPIAESPSG